MDQDRIDDWMETASGIRFQFMNPTPDQIDVNDVALALSRTCRYGGHTSRFYSVAEHCCVMADWVLAQPWGTYRKALTALHHDDAEAYIGDLPRPAKQNIPQFKEVENGIDRAVAKRFGLEHPFDKWLKFADTAILVDERAQVMRQSGNTWAIDQHPPLGVRLWPIVGRFPLLVRHEWRRRHDEWTARLNGTWEPTP
ncbi:hydrolase of HD superfamily [Roseobacter phage RDJL6]|nr:hydrolase of HD superfamily [Roseobacter phage RDJL6]